MPKRKKPRNRRTSAKARPKALTRDKLKRVRTLLVLEKLPSQLRSDVLSDGAIGAKSGLVVQHPVWLGEQLVLTRESMFAAFGAAAAGRKPLPLKDLKGNTVRAKVSVDKNGHGLVQTKKQRTRFDLGGLLTPDPAQRIGFAEAALKSRTLAGEYRERILALTRKADFSNDNFFEVGELFASSPELFAASFNRNLAKQRIGVHELIPQDVRYWDNLTAILKTSRNLVEFIANELEFERKSRIERDPLGALRSISLTFPAPSLVPMHLFKHIDARALETILSSLTDLEDHFALVGLFELCADRVAEGENLVGVGTQILTALIGDMDRLQAASNMFGAGFIVATAYLATHETLGRRPVFWRRLAAAAHASFVVRTSRVAQINGEELINWAFSVAGEDYFTSTFADMADEPNWRPDWIVTRFMVADAVGRVMGALSRIPENAHPAAWTTLVNAARDTLIAQHSFMLITCPAVLEGERRVLADFEIHPNLVAANKQFMEAPDIDNFIKLTPIVQSFQFPTKAIVAVLHVVDIIRRGSPGLEDRTVHAAMTLAAHTALKINSEPLTEAVVRATLDKLRSIKKRQPLVEGTLRLIECSGAYTDRTAGQDALASWFEELAHAVDLRVSADLEGLLDSLARSQPEIAQKFGRAKAILRLGSGNTAAA